LFKGATNFKVLTRPFEQSLGQRFDIEPCSPTDDDVLIALVTAVTSRHTVNRTLDMIE